MHTAEEFMHQMKKIDLQLLGITVATTVCYYSLPDFTHSKALRFLGKAGSLAGMSAAMYPRFKDEIAAIREQFPQAEADVLAELRHRSIVDGADPNTHDGRSEGSQCTHCQCAHGKAKSSHDAEKSAANDAAATAEVLGNYERELQDDGADELTRELNAEIETDIDIAIAEQEEDGYIHLLAAETGLDAEGARELNDEIAELLHKIEDEGIDLSDVSALTEEELDRIDEIAGLPISGRKNKEINELYEMYEAGTATEEDIHSHLKQRNSDAHECDCERGSESDCDCRQSCDCAHGCESTHGEDVSNAELLAAFKHSPQKTQLIALGLGLSVATTALTVAMEKAIYRRAERRRRAGKKFAHTRQSLGLAAVGALGVVLNAFIPEP